MRAFRLVSLIPDAPDSEANGMPGRGGHEVKAWGTPAALVSEVVKACRTGTVQGATASQNGIVVRRVSCVVSVLPAGRSDRLRVVPAVVPTACKVPVCVVQTAGC